MKPADVLRNREKDCMSKSYHIVFTNLHDRDYLDYVPSKLPLDSLFFDGYFQVYGRRALKCGYCGYPKEDMLEFYMSHPDWFDVGVWQTEQSKMFIEILNSL